VGTAASPADQSHSVSPSRLTEALLAAADDVTSSAEKLPVSHRLPVSRSVFDSDEGKTCCCYANYLDNYQGSSVSFSCTCQKFAWSTAVCRCAANKMHDFCLLALSHDPESALDKGREAHHTGCLAEHQMKKLEILFDYKIFKYFMTQIQQDSTLWRAGSLVSSDEEVTISNKGTASANPQGCRAQPLTEEPTLALLPDKYKSFSCSCQYLSL